MRCLDNSVLSDYLRSDNPRHEQAATVIESYDGAWYLPIPVLWEALRYGAQASRKPGVTETEAALNWADPLPVTAGAVTEAAMIEAELLDQGTPINAVDMLIAGIVREAGATIVTRDSDFNRIEGLQVTNIDE
ncbi:tRNA(fMet)-specific endonuclease VapC [Halalkalicoccus paucihalophilus]|uniref:Ribonuclease VapC n=2 Tax=Halalkalicoccus TaxID=332246 RepID=A0A151ABD5_9EURY|nr:tRNA(fMet)-specific endonuclease VapC [Halalkalicoccus paucihalophilus]